MYAIRNLYPVQDTSRRWRRRVRERAVDTYHWRFPAHPDDGRTPDRDDGRLADRDGRRTADPDDQQTVDPEDELFLLGERCAEAYMQAEALQYRAMTLLAEFHHREGWRDTGFSSTAEWLAWRIGIRPGAARERVRTALALESLPETAEAMKNGELSFTKVRALTRVARPDNETTLLAFARAGSAANLERVVRGWKTLDRKSEVSAEQMRHRTRRFSAWVEDNGMVAVRGRLDPEVGALLMRAIEAASDALFRKGAEGGKGGDRCGCGCEGRTEEEARAELPETTPEQRRADAVGLLAERAMAAGFGGGGTGDDDGGDGSQNRGEDGQAPISSTRAERYQVMLHVDAETLEEDGEPGQSELEDGTRVSAETSRRISCDAGLVTISRGTNGQVLGAGRRRRTVAPALRRALEARDRGCRFPGCGLRFTDAHHVRHWADGGETTLGNLVLLCRRHHRAVHEGGVTVCMDVKQQVVFFTPKGRALFGAPPVSPEPGRPREVGVPKAAGVTDVRRTSRARVPPTVDAAAPIPRYKRDADIPWEVEARAWEALDSG
jgi:hypothetical protein